MLTSRELVHGPISVAEYFCTTAPHERPFVEQHASWSISYVRRGSFGCVCRGRQFELVPGAVLIGRPADEFMCTDEHHLGGDECLAFFLEAPLVDEMGGDPRVWRSGALPPLADVIALGELADSAVRHQSGPRVDEFGILLSMKVVAHLGGNVRRLAPPRPADRRRALESAHWIDAHAGEAIDLSMMASRANLSVYHYLRVFTAVLGVTPHQHLLRCRLRRAAQLLATTDLAVTAVAQEVGFADLSNFVRTFRRAARIAPQQYRTAARGNRKILQARLARPS